MPDLTTGYTFASGETITPAKLNAIVGDAVIAADAITTAKIANVQVTAAKLSADAVETAKIKDANVTPAKLSNTFLKFHAHRNGVDQTISDDSATKIVWTTESFDIGSCFASGTFTPTTAGKYLIGGTVAISSLDASEVIIEIRNTAGTRLALLGQARTGASGGTTLSGSTILTANGTTDTFELWVYHNQAGSSASKDVDGTATSSYFWGTLIP
jgi:hypothetical protein